MPFPLAALIPLISSIGGSAVGSLFGRSPNQQFGDVLEKYVQPFSQEVQGRGQAARGQADNFGNWISDLLQQQWPSKYLDTAYDLQHQMFGGMNDLQQGTQGLGNFLGGMNRNLDYINQYGLPGNLQVQNEQQGLGNAQSQLLGLGGGYGVQQLLQQIMSGGLPNQQAMQGLFGPTAAMGQGGAGQALNLTNQILQRGLPGQQLIQNLIGQGTGAGLSGLGNAQAFAQAGMGGLPGQRAISGLVNPLATQGLGNQGAASQQLQRTAAFGAKPLTDIERQAQGKLSGLIEGSGVSPEYVAALRRTVLDPAMEETKGRLAQMSGGQASLASPAYQEILRKQESDFADRLTARGFENLQGFIGQGLGAGQQSVNQQLGLAQALGGLGQGQIGSALGAFGAVPQNQLPFAQLSAQTGSNLLGQGLNAFGAIPQNVMPFASLSGNLGANLLGQATNQFQAVPGAVAPFAQMGASLGLGLGNQSLDRFQVGNQLGMNALNMVQNLRMQPQQALMNQVYGAFDRNLGAGMGLLGAGQNFLQNQQNYDINQLDQWGALVRQMLGAQQNEQNLRYQTQAGRGAAIGGGLANALPGILRSIPGLGGNKPYIDESGAYDPNRRRG